MRSFYEVIYSVWPDVMSDPQMLVQGLLLFCSQIPIVCSKVGHDSEFLRRLIFLKAFDYFLLIEVKCLFFYEMVVSQ